MNSDKIEIILQLQDRMSKQLETVVGNMNKAQQSSGGLLNSIGSLAPAIGAAYAVGAVKDFTMATLEAFGKQEQFNVALKTMLHGNALEAENLQGKLIELAKTTPFELSQVQDATRQLIAYGFEARNITGNLRMLGDVAAGVGAPIGDIAYLYGTLKTQEKAMTKDLYQFANRGIPIIDALAKHFKIANKEVFKFAEDGKISFRDIERAFRGMTQEGGQFFNMMSEQSKTLDGQLSNLSDAFEQLKVGIGENLADAAKDVVSFMTTITNEANEGLQALNSLNRTFKKENLQFSLGERVFGQDEMVKYGILQKQLGDMISAAGNDPLKLQQAKSNVANRAKKNIDDYLTDSQLADVNGETLSTDRIEEFRRTRLMLQEATAKITNEMQQRKNLMAKEKAGLFEKDKKDPKEIRGNTPKQINITIMKGIEDVTIHSQTVKEGAEDALQIFGKALTSILNDTNAALQ
jgi:hypothetical protein